MEAGPLRAAAANPTDPGSHTRVPRGQSFRPTSWVPRTPPQRLASLVVLDTLLPAAGSFTQGVSSRRYFRQYHRL